MKLRTVLNELACTDWRAGKEKLLDEDVLLTPEYDTSVPPEACLVRMCRFSEFQEGTAKPGPSHIMLVLAGPEIPAGARVAGDFVLVAARASYDDFRAAFLDLPAKAAVLELRRDRMFEAFLASYDLPQFAKRSSAVLGNPVIITNADMRLLGTAGDFPEDAPDVQQVLSQGYATEEVNTALEDDGMIDSVRHARHSVMSNVVRYGRRWVTSIIHYHHLEMGRYDVMEKDRPITGFDLELIDYAGQLAGVMIDRLGAAGERVGSGSSVLRDLVEGSFVNVQTMRAQVLLTSLPLDVSYVLLVVTGQRNADKDYHARVGTMCARALRNSLWCARENCLVVLAPIGKNETAGYDDYARAQRRLTSNKALMTTLANNELSLFVSEPFGDLLMCPGRLREATDLEKAIREPEPGRARELGGRPRPARDAARQARGRHGRLRPRAWDCLSADGHHERALPRQPRRRRRGAERPPQHLLLPHEQGARAVLHRPEGRRRPPGAQLLRLHHGGHGEIANRARCFFFRLSTCAFVIQHNACAGSSSVIYTPA